MAYIGEDLMLAAYKADQQRREEEENERGILDRVFGMILNTSVTNALYNATDDDPNTTVLGGIAEGIKYMNPFEDDVSNRHTFSDVLQNVGWEDKDPDKLTASDVGRGVVGFVGDVLLDPTTYLTGGISGAAKLVKGTGTVVKDFSAVSSAANTLKSDAVKAFKSEEKVKDAGQVAKNIKDPLNAVRNAKATVNNLDMLTAQKVIEKKYKDIGKEVDVDTINKEAYDLCVGYNKKVNKIKQGGTDVSFGMKSVPFSSRVKIGERTLDTFNKHIISADRLRELGDKTIAPYYNGLAKEIRESKLGQKFNKYSDIAKLAKESPEEAAALYHLTELVKSKDAARAAKNIKDYKDSEEIAKYMESLDETQQQYLLRAIEDGTMANVAKYVQKKNEFINKIKNKETNRDKIASDMADKIKLADQKELDELLEKLNDYKVKYDEQVKRNYTYNARRTLNLLDFHEGKFDKRIDSVDVSDIDFTPPETLSAKSMEMEGVFSGMADEDFYNGSLDELTLAMQHNDNIDKAFVYMDELNKLGTPSFMRETEKIKFIKKLNESIFNGKQVIGNNIPDKDLKKLTDAFRFGDINAKRYALNKYVATEAFDSEFFGYVHSTIPRSLFEHYGLDHKFGGITGHIPVDGEDYRHVQLYAQRFLDGEKLDDELVENLERIADSLYPSHGSGIERKYPSYDKLTGDAKTEDKMRWLLRINPKFFEEYNDVFNYERAKLYDERNRTNFIESFGKEKQTVEDPTRRKTKYEEDPRDRDGNKDYVRDTVYDSELGYLTEDEMEMLRHDWETDYLIPNQQRIWNTFEKPYTRLTDKEIQSFMKTMDIENDSLFGVRGAFSHLKDSEDPYRWLMKWAITDKSKKGLGMQKYEKTNVSSVKLDEEFEEINRYMEQLQQKRTQINDSISAEIEMLMYTKTGKLTKDKKKLNKIGKLNKDRDNKIAEIDDILSKEQVKLDALNKTRYTDMPVPLVDLSGRIIKNATSTKKLATDVLNHQERIKAIDDKLATNNAKIEQLKAAIEKYQITKPGAQSNLNFMLEDIYTENMRLNQSKKALEETIQELKMKSVTGAVKERLEDTGFATRAEEKFTALDIDTQRYILKKYRDWQQNRTNKFFEKFSNSELAEYIKKNKGTSQASYAFNILKRRQYDEFAKTFNEVRTAKKEELKTKYVTASGLKTLQKQVDELTEKINSFDYKTADEVVKYLDQFKSSADSTINTEIAKSLNITLKTMSKYEKLANNDTVMTVYKLFNDKMDELAKLEIQAGRLTEEQYEALKGKYVPHILTPEGKTFWKSLDEETTNPSGKFNPDVTGSQKSFDKSRTFKSIQEANDFYKSLKYTGVDKMFETSLSEIYLARCLGSNKLVYSEDVLSYIKKGFGSVYDGKRIDGKKTTTTYPELNRLVKAIVYQSDTSENVVLNWLGIKPVMFSANNALIALSDEQIGKITRLYKKIYPNSTDGGIRLYNMSPEVIDRVNVVSFNQRKMLEKDFVNIFDKYQTIWKMWNSVVNPGFHIQNSLSNAFQSFLSIGSAAFNPKKIKRAAQILSSGDPKQTLTLNGVDYTYKELKMMAEEYGLLNSFFGKDMEIYTYGQSKLTEGKIQAKYDPTSLNDFIPYKIGGKIGSAIEESQRMNMFIDLLDKGYKPEVAVDEVNKFLFDYADLTDFERTTMKRLIPFYTFMRKNVPMELEQMIEQPQTFSFLDKGLTEIQQMNGEYIPENERNEWRQDYVQLPFNIGGEQVGINLNLPYQQLDRLTPNKLLGQTSPAIKAPIENILGKYLYTGVETGSPLEYLMRQSTLGNMILNTSEKEGLNRTLYPIGQLTGLPIGTM